MERESPLNLEERQRKSFPEWFKDHIQALYSEESSEVTDELYALSFGPDDRVGTYTMCTMNGIKWHVKQIENSKSVQNSGIMVPGLHGHHKSDFYGQLVSIVRVPYMNGYSVFLYKGEWFDTNCKKRKRVVRDYHFMSVNTNNLWYKDDPYVLATQAQQIFYLDDPNLGYGWKVIQKIRHRHVWDIPENEETYATETNYVDETNQEEVGDLDRTVEDENVDLTRSLRRDDVEPEIHVLSHKDLAELDSFANDDFIDDDPQEGEILSRDEEDENNNDYSDSD